MADRDAVNEAAYQHLAAQGWSARHNEQFCVTDAFIAGARWQAKRSDAVDQCEDVETGRYRALIAMLAEINKTTVETKAERHTRLGAFHQIMERIEGKVDAVLDQVMPKDKAEPGAADYSGWRGYQKAHGLDPDMTHWNRVTGRAVYQEDELTTAGPVVPVNYCGPDHLAGVAEERGPVRLSSEGKGGPVYTSTAENKSKWFREPVTDESGVSVGAGAGPLKTGANHG